MGKKADIFPSYYVDIFGDIDSYSEYGYLLISDFKELYKVFKDNLKQKYIVSKGNVDKGIVIKGNVYYVSDLDDNFSYFFNLNDLKTFCKKKADEIKEDLDVLSQTLGYVLESEGEEGIKALIKNTDDALLYKESMPTELRDKTYQVAYFLDLNYSALGTLKHLPRPKGYLEFRKRLAEEL